MLRLQALVLELASHHHLLLDTVGALPRFGLYRVARRAFQFPPGAVGQLFGAGHDVGHGVIAEDKTDAAVGVPAVEVLGLGEVGVAAQQHAPEAALEADGQGPIHLLRRSLVRRPIPRPVDQAQDFPRMGQRQHQGVIAPGAVVGDVHALFALTCRGHQGAVHVQRRLLEEGVRLPSPDLDAPGIEDVQQRQHVGAAEASAEVARGGWIGDAARAQGIEEHLVVAPQFDVLQAGAVTESVVSEVENVIRFVKGQVDLEQVQPVVDGVDQADLSGQGVEGADPAMGDPTAAVTDLLMNVAGREHRLVATTELGLVQAPHDPALALSQLAVDSRVHSKSLLVSRVQETPYSLRPRNRRRISSFS